MFRRCVVLAAVVALATTGSARAVLITASATANQPAAGGPAPVNNVILMQGAGTGGGVSYSNQYTSNGFPVSGDQSRTITATVITGYTAPGFTPANFGTNKLVAVFAGNSVSNVVAGTSTGTYTPGSGTLGLFVSPQAVGFDRATPSTWFSSLTPLATFTVGDQQLILPGTGEPLLQPAFTTNTFATNLTLGNGITGYAIFNDVTDPFFDVNNPAGTFERLIAIVNETVVDPAAGTGSLLVDAADLAALNALAGALGLSNLGGANTGFATGINGALATDFNSLRNAPGGAFTEGSPGDFTANTGADFTGAFEIDIPPPPPIPEPATMAVFGLIGATTVLVRRRRLKAA